MKQCWRCFKTLSKQNKYKYKTRTPNSYYALTCYTCWLEDKGFSKKRELQRR